jgi:hypothetical protein
MRFQSLWSCVNDDTLRAPDNGTSMISLTAVRDGFCGRQPHYVDKCVQISYLAVVSCGSVAKFVSHRRHCEALCGIFDISLKLRTGSRAAKVL